MDPTACHAYNGCGSGDGLGAIRGGGDVSAAGGTDGEYGNVNNTLQQLRQHELIILRRLRGGPLTEFELAAEIAEHSGYTAEQAADKLAGWLEELRTEGYLWAGALLNADGQQLMAAALTKQGRELVN